jgi:hypothetical protein
MYLEVPRSQEQSATDAAARLLRLPTLLRAAMRRTLREWPVAAEQNLSNGAKNRQAWMGQAACFLATGSPDYLTKLAWHTLTAAQQSAANDVAGEVISEWEACFE